MNRREIQFKNAYIKIWMVQEGYWEQSGLILGTRTYGICLNINFFKVQHALLIYKNLNLQCKQQLKKKMKKIKNLKIFFLIIINFKYVNY